MKKFNIYILVLIFLTISNFSYGNNIVYANLDNIIKTSDVGKKIIVYFDDKNKKILEEIKVKEQQIREKEKSLISQKNILEPDEFKKKVDSFKEEIKKFNQTRQSKTRQINLEKDQVSKSFLDEINKILKEFAEKNNIDIIISSNQMLIGKSDLDVTNKLLIMVNEKIKNFDIKK